MKMLCWANCSDSHGLVLSNAIWIPDGEYPEQGIDGDHFERIPSLDFERGEVQRLDLRMADRVRFGYTRKDRIVQFEEEALKKKNAWPVDLW